MFIGHYAAAFGARAFKPAIPLWQLFLAVQAVDIGWAILVLLGVEKFRIIPGFLEASPLDLYYMPFTHSLVASVIWAVVLGILYALRRKGVNARAAGIILGFAVLSHWFADLLVHAPDLPLVSDDPKFGFGLWRSILWSQIAEIGLLALGFWFYLRNTKAIKPSAKWLLFALVGFMVLVQVYSLTSAAPTGEGAVSEFAITALVSYFIFAGLAFAVDRTRKSLTH